MKTLILCLTSLCLFFAFTHPVKADETKDQFVTSTGLALYYIFAERDFFVFTANLEEAKIHAGLLASDESFKPKCINGMIRLMAMDEGLLDEAADIIDSEKKNEKTIDTEKKSAVNAFLKGFSEFSGIADECEIRNMGSYVGKAMEIQKRVKNWR